MATVHVMYAITGDPGVDLPAYDLDVAPGLAIVRENPGELHTSKGRYGIVHVESSAFLPPMFVKLANARAALRAIAGMMDWTLSYHDLCCTRASGSFVPVAAALREAKAAEEPRRTGYNAVCAAVAGARA